MPTNTTISYGNFRITATGAIEYWNGVSWINIQPEDNGRSMPLLSITHTATNVNTKSLAKKVAAMVEEGARDFIMERRYLSHATIDYSHFVEYVEAALDEMYEDKLITTHNILCDHRNNIMSEVAAGTIYAEVTFKQFNCLNVTKMNFHIIMSVDGKRNS